MSECMFGKDGRCAILDVFGCPKHCKFRKTEAEFYAAQEEAAKILEKKGLRPAIVRDDNKCIMSVKEDK